jgi:hypothetical protein
VISSSPNLAKSSPLNMSRGSLPNDDHGSLDDIPMFSFTNLSYLTEKNKDLAATHRRTNSADFKGAKPIPKAKSTQHRNSNL